MIKVINSKDLKTNADLVCTFCEKNLNTLNVDGSLVSKEGKDFVFETDSKEEWCICVPCKEEADKHGLE